LPTEVKQELTKKDWIRTVQLSPEVEQLLDQNLVKYQDSNQQIQKLVDHGYLVTGVPIKLQTFKEKQRVIRNFDQSIEWYNAWAEKNGFDLVNNIDAYAKIESSLDRLPYNLS
jgi:hypothetical protein